MKQVPKQSIRALNFMKMGVNLENTKHGFSLQPTKLGDP